MTDPDTYTWAHLPLSHPSAHLPDLRAQPHVIPHLRAHLYLAAPSPTPLLPDRPSHSQRHVHKPPTTHPPTCTHTHEVCVPDCPTCSTKGLPPLQRRKPQKQGQSPKGHLGLTSRHPARDSGSAVFWGEENKERANHLSRL